MSVFTVLNIKVLASTQQAKKELDSFASKAKGVGDKLTGLGSKMTMGITLPVLAAGAGMFKLAADSEDALSAVNDVFGKSAKEIEKWAATGATAFGMSRTEAYQSATAFGILAQAHGITGAAVDAFAKQQTELASDLKSFYGGTVAEAQTAIQALYRGETEPIRKYGVMVDAAAVKTEALRLGLIKEGEDLDKNSKLLATQSLVMSQTAVAQGNFKKTIDGASNSMEVAKANFKNAADTIGQRLLPIGTQLIGMVSGWVQKFSELSPGMQDTIIKVVALAAALGPAISIVGNVIKVVGLLGKALSFLAANPVVLVIAAIAGLVFLVVKYWDEIKAVTVAVWSGIKDFLGALWGKITAPFRAAWQGMADFFAGIWDGIKSVVKGVVNFIIGNVNRMIRGLNKVGELAGKIPGVPDFRINELPMLAKGGTAITSGSAIVGEEGPEMIHMGRGASVVPLGAGSGGITHNHYYTIQGSVWSERELAEVIRKQQSRTGIRNVSAFGGVA